MLLGVGRTPTGPAGGSDCPYSSRPGSLGRGPDQPAHPKLPSYATFGAYVLTHCGPTILVIAAKS